MQVLGRMMDHIRLVSRMAKATHTDLVGAFRSGDLPVEEWADIVQTCRHCEWAGRCPGWLDNHPDVNEAPPECLNRTRFSALRQRAERAEAKNGT